MFSASSIARNKEHKVKEETHHILAVLIVKDDTAGLSCTEQLDGGDVDA